MGLRRSLLGSGTRRCRNCPTSISATICPANTISKMRGAISLWPMIVRFSFKNCRFVWQALDIIFSFPQKRTPPRGQGSWKGQSSEKLQFLLTCSVRRPPTLPASQDFVKGYTYLHYSLKKRGGQGRVGKEVGGSSKLSGPNFTTVPLILQVKFFLNEFK